MFFLCRQAHLIEFGYKEERYYFGKTSTDSGCLWVGGYRSGYYPDLVYLTPLGHKVIRFAGIPRRGMINQPRVKPSEEEKQKQETFP